jgi:hypothetical protein
MRVKKWPDTLWYPANPDQVKILSSDDGCA